MRPATITARIAELPATSSGLGEDRVRIGRNAVVVLDGASGTDRGVSVSTYVDCLAHHLIEALDSDSAVPLTEAVSTSIGRTASSLDLTPGRAPSSTVSIVRQGTNTVDVLILGDSPVYVAHHGRTDRLSDDRLARLDLPSRTRLLQRLEEGHGYDDGHSEIGRRMPGEKAPHMNRPGGYWIAEAHAEAGTHSLVYSYPTAEILWCVLLTDGADEPASHLGIAVEDLAMKNEQELREMLDRMHHWENETDPEAQHLPRFKRHDDKTIAVVRFA